MVSSDKVSVNSIDIPGPEQLPELRKEFPEWREETAVKAALQALEISFRLVSTALLCDPRPNSPRIRRLESLVSAQLDLIASLVAESGLAPVVDPAEEEGAAGEVWRGPGGRVAVSRASEGSLLPRLAAWRSAEEVAERMAWAVERAMGRCPLTLGLGEPNLACKPVLRYDQLCRPAHLHALLPRRHLYPALARCWARCLEAGAGAHSAAASKVATHLLALVDTTSEAELWSPAADKLHRSPPPPLSTSNALPH